MKLLISGTFLGGLQFNTSRTLLGSTAIPPSVIMCPIQPESTLAKLGIQLMLPKLLQHKPQVLFMFFLIPREYQNVINEYHNKLIEILHEYLVH
jgi:hypothetical protein